MLGARRPARPFGRAKSFSVRSRSSRVGGCRSHRGPRLRASRRLESPPGGLGLGRASTPPAARRTKKARPDRQATDSLHVTCVRPSGRQGRVTRGRTSFHAARASRPQAAAGAAERPPACRDEVVGCSGRQVPCPPVVDSARPPGARGSGGRRCHPSKVPTPKRRGVAHGDLLARLRVHGATPQGRQRDFRSSDGAHDVDAL